MIPDKTLSEMISVKIQIEDKESYIKAKEQYIETRKLKGSKKEKQQYLISLLKDSADELKTRFNELLATVKPY